MAAFMQQEFNIAVATMNVKPTSSFMMHIFIHGYAEFIQSQVKIVVNNALLLIIRAATKERKIIALTISTSSSSIYYTLSSSLISSNVHSLCKQLLQPIPVIILRKRSIKTINFSLLVTLLLFVRLECMIISDVQIRNEAGRIFFFSPLFSPLLLRLG